MVGSKREIAQHHRRLRFLYSVGDFQFALSAVAFLTECEPEKKYSRIELRRFKCYETSAIIAYTRPFAQSKGEVPSLTLKMIGAKLNDQQIKLHRALMLTRNKVVAHSDAAMMRINVKTHCLPLREDLKFLLLQTVFDEGLTYIGGELHRFNMLLHLLHRTLYEKLLQEAQEKSELFNFYKDYLIE